ncbi:MAG: hypothetical protein B5M53_00780 [Candidatus Cloacimonas sp. 4484_209]|nr:MAG: hypothetical protein B5M53_00780 [Candidatus Cloacimonas sp. 4484_209]
MKEIDLIEECVRMEEDTRLSEAIDFYWPVKKGKEEKNDMSERNLSLHVMRSFIKKDFHVYAEVPCNDGSNEHVDFIAMKPDGKAADILVVGEAKNLYGSQQAKAMCTDIDKINNFELPGEKEDKPEYRLKIGLLIAFTWDKKIFEWWNNWDSDNPLGGGGEGWKDLWKKLKNAIRGTYLLYDGEEGETERMRKCNALYAIFLIK